MFMAFILFINLNIFLWEPNLERHAICEPLGSIVCYIY